MGNKNGYLFLIYNTNQTQNRDPSSPKQNQNSKQQKSEISQQRKKKLRNQGDSLNLLINGSLTGISILLASKGDLRGTGDEAELLLDLFKGLENHPCQRPSVGPLRRRNYHRTAAISGRRQPENRRRGKQRSTQILPSRTSHRESRRSTEKHD